MSRADEVSERLRASIEELAGARAGDLVREAEAEARAAVKAALRDEMARAMLAKSEELLAPPARSTGQPARSAREPAASQPPAEKGEGWWLYCVVGQGHPGLPADVEGVAP